MLLIVYLLNARAFSVCVCLCWCQCVCLYARVCLYVHVSVRLCVYTHLRFHLIAVVMPDDSKGSPQLCVGLLIEVIIHATHRL